MIDFHVYMQAIIYLIYNYMYIFFGSGGNVNDLATGQVSYCPFGEKIGDKIKLTG